MTQYLIKKFFQYFKHINNRLFYRPILTIWEISKENTDRGREILHLFVQK